MVLANFAEGTTFTLYGIDEHGNEIPLKVDDPKP